MAARAGVEPTTLRLKVIDSTNAPPRPTLMEVYKETEYQVEVLKNENGEVKLGVFELISGKGETVFN